MIAYFHRQGKLVNTETMTHAEVVPTSDNYPMQEHVIVHFTGGNFLEFPPEVSLYSVYAALKASPIA